MNLKNGIMGQLISMMGGPEKVFSLLISEIPRLEDLIAQAMMAQTESETPEDWQWVSYSMKDIKVGEANRVLVIKSYAKIVDNQVVSSAPIEKYTLEEFVRLLVANAADKKEPVKQLK